MCIRLKVRWRSGWHELLSPLVDRVLVCDRRGEKRTGNKADKLDADEGSELLRRGALRAVYHGERSGSRLKEYARTYDNVVEDATRVMLRVKALFRARAIKAPGKGAYQPRLRTKRLSKLEDPAVHFRARCCTASWMCCAQCGRKRSAYL